MFSKCILINLVEGSAKIIYFRFIFCWKHWFFCILLILIYGLLFWFILSYFIKNFSRKSPPYTTDCYCQRINYLSRCKKHNEVYIWQYKNTWRIVLQRKTLRLLQCMLLCIAFFILRQVIVNPRENVENSSFSKITLRKMEKICSREN